MLAAALTYAAAGWPTFPLASRGKVPATASGFKAATTDPEQVHQWWTDQPRANIGVATGAAGLVVIDVDSKPEVDGWTTWCQLVTDHAPDGLLVDTFEVTTPSGGQHAYFLAPPGDPIRNSASKVGPGVDVRAAGGYIVGPPSVTAAGRYEVDREHPVAPLPAWLDALLRPPRPATQRPTQARTTPLVRPRDPYAAAALEAELAAVASAPTGTRNDTLNTASFNLGQLIAAGKLDGNSATAALLGAAVSAGLSEREAVATITSGITAGLREPRAAA